MGKTKKEEVVAAVPAEDKKKAGKTKAAEAPKKPEPKKVKEETESDSDSSSEEEEKPTTKAAPKGKPAKKEESESEESSEEESEEEQEEKQAGQKRKNDGGAAESKKSKGGDESATICVKNLPWSATSEELGACLKEIVGDDEIQEVDVKFGQDGRARGFAFVVLTSKAAGLLMPRGDIELGGRCIRFEASNRTPRDDNGREPSAPSATLIVKSLSWNTTNDTLAGHFDGCTSARVLTDRETGNSKGFGFVDFESVEAATAAYESLNGSELDGRSIILDYSQPRPQGDRPGGDRGGRGGFGGRGGGRGGFGDRGGRGGRGGFGGRGGGRGGFGGRGGQNRGAISNFEGQKIKFD